MIYSTYYLKSYVISAFAKTKNQPAQPEPTVALRVHNTTKLLAIAVLFTTLFTLTIKQHRAAVRRRRHKTTSLKLQVHDFEKFATVASAYSTYEVNQFSKLKPDVGLNLLGNLSHYSELKWMYQTTTNSSDIIGQTAKIEVPTRGIYGFTNKFLNI